MHRMTERALDRIKQCGFADRVLFPDEKPDALYEFCDELLLEFRPCGRVQEECLLAIATPLWRKLHPLPQRVTRRPHRTLAEVLRDHDERLARKAKTEKNDHAADQEEKAPEKLGSQSAQDLNCQPSTALDEKIDLAIKRMIALKQMQSANTLGR